MNKRRIMVVDDEENFLQIVKLNLEETGQYEVLTLSTAKNILDELHRFRPDLIFLDLLMPSVGGIDACEELNHDDLGRKTPIIIVSGLAKEQDKLKAYKLGVIDYLNKPIDLKTMLKAVDKALGEFKV
ncbi:MAG: response regulator [Candidatus Omnitrophica bacterium]|nr:response regulator [Candidatus Omnitrophota bacterium]